ncbi:MAG: oligosaccharide flippase family protein [Erysipelotrichaceae bacterium]
MNSSNNLGKNVFYNTFGTFFYFFCQWLITVLVVRLSGYKDAGVLSLVISTTNIFYCIGLFGVRNYQISDVSKKHDDSEYFFSRIITVLLSIIIFSISLGFLGFDTVTLTCSIAYMIFKCGEAFSDLYFGIFQRYNTYKQIAISYSLKGILTVTTFAGTLFLTKSLLLAIIVNVIVYLGVLIFYDIPSTNKVTSIKFKKYKIKKILTNCFPLMLYGLMVPYLNFITRYAVEKSYGTEILGYYSSITMVFVIMSTLMGSVFVSIIPKISSYYFNNDFTSIKKLIKNLIIIIFIIAISACLGGFLLGDFAFSLVFGKDILSYMYLLIPTIVSSICLTYASLFSSILISINQNKKVLYGNLISVILCTFTVFLFINKFELLGSLYSLTISLIVSSIVLFMYIFKILSN